MEFDLPISHDGELSVVTQSGEKTIRIKRAHLEEDAGKLIHEEGGARSFVDYNRTGTPLLEIVSEPDINSSDEAYEYLRRLKGILEYLEVSDCNMEEGSLRCDANISLMPEGAKELGEKVELKNMNSFKFVKLALEYEEKRQRELLEKGELLGIMPSYPSSITEIIEIKGDVYGDDGRNGARLANELITLPTHCFLLTQDIKKIYTLIKDLVNSHS